MIKYSDVLAAQSRHEDFRREAEIERLVRSGQPAQARKPVLAQRALGWLGVRLVAWGSRLQRSAYGQGTIGLPADTEQVQV